MTELSNEPALPPTYFANGVTIIINSDEMSLEFRRTVLSHAEHARRYGDQPQLPLTPDQFWAYPPIAKVFLTFAAVRHLRETLNNLVPKFEQARKEGK